MSGCAKHLSLFVSATFPASRVTRARAPGTPVAYVNLIATGSAPSLVFPFSLCFLPLSGPPSQGCSPQRRRTVPPLSPHLASPPSNRALQVRVGFSSRLSPGTSPPHTAMQKRGRGGDESAGRPRGGNFWRSQGPNCAGDPQHPSQGVGSPGGGRAFYGVERSDTARAWGDSRREHVPHPRRTPATGASPPEVSGSRILAPRGTRLRRLVADRTLRRRIYDFAEQARFQGEERR
ncbi:hypothetical protein BESB_012480 [Besnoitia besnoiti]|uniref:Uncharacterized protein n=1 Tax=Besnoitia besnoiti TaxID=94643 RepID=A0A2A9M9N4_BESBE|nr:hypothetical protein BESB_012480 [Besnoitia besnoiti]PFH32636.1 hypothetical protein BESB_012480 [Besnoitia besnoiti]